MAHIIFYREEVHDFVRVGCARSGFQHVSTELQLERRRGDAGYRQNFPLRFTPEQLETTLTCPGSRTKRRGQWLLASLTSPVVEAIVWRS